MGRWYAPVPHDALDCAQDDVERLFILWLYEQRHRALWRPLRYRERKLADEHGLSRRTVRRLLEDLEAEGLVVREVRTTGKRMEGTVLRVFDPNTLDEKDEEGEESTDHDLNHATDHGRTTNGTTGIKVEPEKCKSRGPPPEPRVNHDLNHATDHPLVEEQEQQNKNQEQEQTAVRPVGPPEKVKPAKPSRKAKPLPPGSRGSLQADWDALLRFWAEQALPRMDRRPSSRPHLQTSPTGILVVRALKKPAVGLATLLDAVRFVAASQHFKAQNFRDKRMGLDTISRHADAYARLWEEFGSDPIPGSDKPRNGHKTPKRGTYATPESEAIWQAETDKVRANLGLPPRDQDQTATAGQGSYQRLLTRLKGEA